MGTSSQGLHKEVYLVIVDVTMSIDQGHAYLVREHYWVAELDKQAAARSASKYVRKTYGSDLLSDRVIHVLSKDDWGNKYFTMLK